MGIHTKFHSTYFQCKAIKSKKAGTDQITEKIVYLSAIQIATRSEQIPHKVEKLQIIEAKKI
jgi:hypothetical protein